MEPIQNIKGVFFDLYGTLLIYGDMKAAWSDWLTAFFSKLVPLGLSLSQEDFSQECDRFFGKDPPKNGKDGFTIFENRIHVLCDRLGLVPSVTLLRPIYNKAQLSLITGIIQLLIVYTNRDI